MWEVGFSDSRELGGPCLVWGASVHLSGYVVAFWSQSVFFGKVLDLSWPLLPICEMGTQGGAYLTDGIKIG